MILVLDNYDSFVANIGRYFRNLGASTVEVRNDAITVDEVERLAPRALVISPGPGRPREAGVSEALIRRFSGRVPILGICLGHQAIGEVFGGRIARAREPMHGRASPIDHDGDGLFAKLPRPTTVGRYHSLIVEVDDAPDLIVTARSEAGEIMGLRHRVHPTHGVQFHPESVLTPQGAALFDNFLAIARAFDANERKTA
ncbi:anthranilate synthase component II [Pinisolibacter sp.]|uniref:anthranilate synthase component II n=1 Tax=Pinisolibacter sp. TaxID=2172024 RepID=UPI002FDE9082